MTALSADARQALSFWQGASANSFARTQGVRSDAIARHLAAAQGRRTGNLQVARIAMRELLAAGLIEKGTGTGMYRATAAGLAL